MCGVGFLLFISAVSMKSQKISLSLLLCDTSTRFFLSLHPSIPSPPFPCSTFPRSSASGHSQVRAGLKRGQPLSQLEKTRNIFALGKHSRCHFVLDTTFLVFAGKSGISAFSKGNQVLSRAGISPLLLFLVIFSGRRDGIAGNGRVWNVLGLEDSATTKILLYSHWDLGIT